jgi:hypothetical protein
VAVDKIKELNFGDIREIIGGLKYEVQRLNK